MTLLEKPGLPLRCAALLLAALCGSPAVHADALSAVQVLRAGGCGGVARAAGPLYRERSLDTLARRWAGGATLAEAAQAAGVTATAIAAVQVNAPDADILEVLRRQQCSTLMRQDLRAIGVYRSGSSTWLVMSSGAARAAAPSEGPAHHPRAATGAAAGVVPGAGAAARALQLVNAARAQGGSCGRHSFAPAPPLTLSPTLTGVASGHATDMAQHSYFEHRGRDGQTPAERVRASGYHEKLVGENIAYGPDTVEEAVSGWLASPGHCQNIRDPRFAEMGIAFAPGRAGHRGLYWVQVLAEPGAA